MNKFTSIFFFLFLFAGSNIHPTENFTVSLWLHSSMFSNLKVDAIKELNEKLSYYREIGVENLYVFKTLKKEHKKGWSFLKQILKIAHKKDLKVHPIITPGQRVKIEGKIKRNGDWLIKDQFGKILPYLNLSNPEARYYVLKKVKKLLKYNIDGIHLDYIRFPYLSPKKSGDTIMSFNIGVLNVMFRNFIPDHIYHQTSDNYFSYDKETLESFEKYYHNLESIDPENGQIVLNEWRLWNALNVTKLVRSIRKVILESGNRIPLSAAVMSNHEFALHSLGQDWGTWGWNSFVDVLCPMIYSNDNNWFKERLKGVLDNVQEKCKVYAGIAIKSSSNHNTPDGVREQIKIAKELGADGVVLFSGYSLSEEYRLAIKEKVEGKSKKYEKD